MTPSDFSDDLFESIASTGGRTPASWELRDAVLSQTTRTVRNRRRMRRAGMAGALLACYLGGVATVALWQADRSMERIAIGSAVESAENDDGVADRDVRRLVRPEDDQIADGSMTPAAARLSPYERLCRTGDQQLEKRDDIQAAIRSYKKALQLASADQRSIAPDRDTWLLMALKQSIN
jgi:hypothetical protein